MIAPRHSTSAARFPWSALVVSTGVGLALLAACAVSDGPEALELRAVEAAPGPDPEAEFESYCGPGYCLGDSFCDDCLCYAPDTPISVAACGCELIDPACGVGECVGDSYCDGPGCPGSAICWAPDSAVSQLMCQGVELGKGCQPPSWYCTDDGSYCGPDGCLSPSSAVSQLVCECGLLDPTCGIGSCFGDSYCDGSGCPGSGVCWAPSTVVSQVMCQGGILADCGVSGFEACVPPPGHMVAWWAFDETSGAVANDETLFANDGAHQGGPSPTPGMVDGALAFDGVDDHVEVPDDPSLDFTDGVFSVDFWIHPGDTEDFGSIMLKGEPTPHALLLGGPGFHFFYAHGHINAFFGGSGGGLQLDLSPNFTHHVNAGQDHFVAITVDMNADVRLYVDGVLAKITPLGFGPGWDFSNDEPLVLGGNPGSLPTAPMKFFDGWLDEVEVFDRVLTAAEVDELYAAGSNGKCKIPD